LSREPGDRFDELKLKLVDLDKKELTAEKEREILDMLGAKEGAVIKDYYEVREMLISESHTFWLSTQGDLILRNWFSLKKKEPKIAWGYWEIILAESSPLLTEEKKSWFSRLFYF